MSATNIPIADGPMIDGTVTLHARLADGTTIDVTVVLDATSSVATKHIDASRFAIMVKDHVRVRSEATHANGDAVTNVVARPKDN